jgi:hypothetical protein
MIEGLGRIVSSSDFKLLVIFGGGYVAMCYLERFLQK